MSGRFSLMKKSCVSCKRYRDHLGGKMNCFLRRMTANYKDGMIMPNRFLNHFEGKISGTVKLESPNGNLYDVEVAERVNKTVLRCGWEAFVDAHHIEENDSVLFRHIENSRFEVLILDSDDCEKVIPCSGIKNTSHVQERRVGSVKISSSSCDDTTQSSGSKRFARCRRGSSSHRREIEKMAAKSCSSEESGEDSPSENESVESDDLRPPPGPDYVLSRRSYLSDAEKDKVFALIQKIQPEVTVFVAIMRKCSVKPSAPFVVISKDYAAVHFPPGSATVTLQRPDKCKKWRPRFYKRKDGSACMLKGNWLDFVRDNRVQEGDICLFVPTKGGRRFTFTVHLLHAAAAHSRAGTGVQRVGSCHGRTIAKMASAVHIKEEPTDGENASSESDKHGVSHESLESMDSDDPPEPSYFLPLRSCLSQSQKKLVEERVRAIQSEIPIYVAIMKNVHQHRTLEFASRYAELHLPDRDQTLVLHCMGKVWKTKMLICNRKIRNRWFLSGGWSKFTRDNHLRVGDICLFELKKNERKLAMTIHIIFSEQC